MKVNSISFGEDDLPSSVTATFNIIEVLALYGMLRNMRPAEYEQRMAHSSGPIENVLSQLENQVLNAHTESLRNRFMGDRTR